MSRGTIDLFRIAGGAFFLAFVAVVIPLVFFGHVSSVLAGSWIA